MKVKKKKTIYLAMPQYGGMHPYTRSCVMDFIAFMASQHYRIVEDMPVACSLIPKARNDIMKNFMSTDFEYMLFIDSDQIFPHDTFFALEAHKKDVCGAVVVKKFPPHYPALMKMGERKGQRVPLQVIDFPLDRVFQVDGIGMACTLLRRDAIEKIKPPYFSSPGLDLEGGLVFGEDWMFCLNAQGAGVELWADPILGQRVFHIGDYPFGMREYLAYKEGGKALLDNIEKKIVTKAEDFSQKYQALHITDEKVKEDIIK